MVKISTKVVVPAPFRPNRPNIDDFLISMLTPFKALTGVLLTMYYLTKLFIFIALDRLGLPYSISDEAAELSYNSSVN